MCATFSLHIKPAYGRKYSSPEEAVAAWKDGRDFKIIRGPYLSIRDSDQLLDDGYNLVVINLPSSIQVGVFLE